jgi:small subunit ribosomal protein S8
MLNDPLADALSTIRNAETIGKGECIVKASKLIGRVLKVMQDQEYIGSFERIDDGKSGLFKVKLLGNINKCGVIKPRYSIKRKDFDKWESRYLPAQNFGAIILTTNRGILSQYEAKEEGIGGRLLAYVY